MQLKRAIFLLGGKTHEGEMYHHFRFSCFDDYSALSSFYFQMVISHFNSWVRLPVIGEAPFGLF